MFAEIGIGGNSGLHHSELILDDADLETVQLGTISQFCGYKIILLKRKKRDRKEILLTGFILLLEFGPFNRTSQIVKKERFHSQIHPALTVNSF